MRLDDPGRLSISLVLDCSDGSRSAWNAISRFTSELVETLPASAHCRVYFLGSGESFDGRQFASSGASWYRKNVSRARILGATLESIPANPTSHVVVASAGRIIDAEDWIDAKEWQMSFVRFGNTILTNADQEELSPQVESVRERVHNPVVQVVFRGDAWMPFYWDNANYQWDADKEHLANVQAERGSVEVHLGILIDQAGKVTAECRLKDGSIREIGLTADNPATSTPQWLKLPETESEVLRQSLQGCQFVCPLPGPAHSHDAFELSCTEDHSRVLGQPICPTLLDCSDRGFALIRDFADGVRYSLHDHDAVMGPGYSVAVRQNRRSVLHYEYSQAAGRWTRRKSTSTVFRADSGGTYAIVL